MSDVKYIEINGEAGLVEISLIVTDNAGLVEISLIVTDNAKYSIILNDVPNENVGLQLGETITTAYRGDRGKIAYEHSQSPHAAIGEPLFTAWLNSNPLSSFLTQETDPIFQQWLSLTPPLYSYTETDPIFQQWLNSNPLAEFLTEETDPIFQQWLNSNPLNGFLTDESDPIVGAIDGIVKADGAGNISVAVPMTDYMLPFSIYSATPWTNNHVYNVGDIFSALEEGGSTSYCIVHTIFTSDATYNLTGKESLNCYTFFIQDADVANHEETYDHSLINSALQQENDPIFNNWLSNTPPAYPSDALWEIDGATTIKPIDAKTVDAQYITGEFYGGLFQP